MRILVLHSRYASDAVSGENRVVDDEVQLLRSGEHDVEVWSPAVGEGGVSAMVRIGGRAIWSRSAAATVRDIVEEFEADVVHCHNLYPMLSPSVIRGAGRVPVVVTLHNYRLMCLSATLLRNGRVCETCVGHAPWPGVAHRCYRGSLLASGALATSIAIHRAARTFGRVSLYLAVTEFVRRKHLDAGYPASEVIVKPNFCGPSQKRQSPGEDFVYAGRLSEEKGIYDLAAGWAGPAKLVVLGDGDLRPRLEALANDRVELRGSVSPATVRSVIAGARAVMIPSLCYEGMPRVALEAFSAGVPVIASAAGALPEIVTNGHTGLLVRPGDTVGWRDAVNRLGCDSLSQQLGREAYRRWSNAFSPEPALRNLEAAYERVVAVKPGRRRSGVRSGIAVPGA